MIFSNPDNTSVSATVVQCTPWRLACGLPCRISVWHIGGGGVPGRFCVPDICFDCHSLTANCYVTRRAVIQRNWRTDATVRLSVGQRGRRHFLREGGGRGEMWQIADEVVSLRTTAGVLISSVRNCRWNCSGETRSMAWVILHPSYQWTRSLPQIDLVSWSRRVLAFEVSMNLSPELHLFWPRRTRWLPSVGFVDECLPVHATTNKNQGWPI